MGKGLKIMKVVMNDIIVFQDKVNFVVWRTKGSHVIPIFGKGERGWNIGERHGYWKGKREKENNKYSNALSQRSRLRNEHAREKAKIVNIGGQLKVGGDPTKIAEFDRQIDEYSKVISSSSRKRKKADVMIKKVEGTKAWKRRSKQVPKVAKRKEHKISKNITEKNLVRDSSGKAVGHILDDVNMNDANSFRSKLWEDSVFGSHFERAANELQENFVVMRDRKRNVMGAMLLKNDETKRSIYIDFLETAPGLKSRKIKGVGTKMVLDVIDTSESRGFGGKVTLDSTTDAAGFYRKLGFKSDKKIKGRMSLNINDSRKLKNLFK